MWANAADTSQVSKGEKEQIKVEGLLVSQYLAKGKNVIPEITIIDLDVPPYKS